MSAGSAIHVAIACGGTGGHLFPGLAVAGQLIRRNCAVTLLVSPKEVDQQAVRQAAGMEIVTLPAVGLSRGRALAFLRGSAQSYRAARKSFAASRPNAVLAMGGFTSAPPILAAKRIRAATFLHESNTIPGRANRWLARVVDGAFVGFPQAAARLRNRRITCTGTPVRSQFQPREPGACRAELGLDPERPVLLVMGGSQGAAGINELVFHALPLLARAAPHLQLFHLAGDADTGRLRQNSLALGVRAVVHPFFAEMEVALGAATVAISRAGASSLAELAAMRVPGVLVPFPAATDNHQFHNALAIAETGAARLLEQSAATPDKVAALVMDWIGNADAIERARSALARWHTPLAAEQIAELMLARIAQANDRALRRKSSGPHGCGCGCHDANHVESRSEVGA